MAGSAAFDNTNGFVDRILAGNYGSAFQYLTPKAVMSKPFLDDYISSAEYFANYNIINKVGGVNYHLHTTVSPYSLQKIVLSTILWTKLVSKTSSITFANILLLLSKQSSSIVICAEQNRGSKKNIAKILTFISYVLFTEFVFTLINRRR